MKGKIQVGLLGVGRLGKIYALDLATRIPEVRLVALGDPDAGSLARVAEELEISRTHADPLALIADKEVEAVVVASPTRTHRELVEAAAAAGKPIFCEKPLALSLEDSLAMKQAVDKSGVFFQMGFMRRFDRGYRVAKQKIEEGLIGKPVVFKSSSRDPYLPPLHYLDPASSGGIFIDMGIHDFDLALWLFGPIKTVHSFGAVLAYPEVEPLGDVDNAVTSLVFEDGRLGLIDLSRNGVYGYDIFTDILGTEGTLKIGYLKETPLRLLRLNEVSHDVVPFFPERFGEAYLAQLRDFALNLHRDQPPPITLEDGIAALRVAIAATESFRQGRAVDVT